MDPSPNTERGSYCFVHIAQAVAALLKFGPIRLSVPRKALTCAWCSAPATFSAEAVTP